MRARSVVLTNAQRQKINHLLSFCSFAGHVHIKGWLPPITNPLCVPVTWKGMIWGFQICISCLTWLTLRSVLTLMPTIAWAASYHLKWLFSSPLFLSPPLARNLRNITVSLLSLKLQSQDSLSPSQCGHVPCFPESSAWDPRYKWKPSFNVL